MGPEEDSRERIMEATYRALAERGYADLTMSDIATESGTSTGLLHYHYDTKEELLVAFLDDAVDRLEADLEDMAAAGPVEGLYRVLSLFVLGDDDPEREAFHGSLLELRAQAPHNARYRARFQRADRAIRTTIVQILESGVESGVFENGDHILLAQLLLAAMDGGRSRGLATGTSVYARRVREAIFEYVLSELLTDAASDPWAELRDEASLE